MHPLSFSSKNAPRKRSDFLDVYRGLAVLLMVVFHFCWDLRNFGFMEYSIYDPFWVHFRSIILILFFTAIGWSSYLTLKKGSQASYWKRDGKLLLCALTISLATYFMVPDQWVYFGIFHFIFIASLLARPFTKWPLLSAMMGTIVLFIYHLTDYLLFPNAFSTITHYISLPQRTLDIVFPFPWIGVIFIGPLLGYLRWHTYHIPRNILTRALAFMGRHALLIYLVHQVFLFTLVAGFKMVLSYFL